MGDASREPAVRVLRCGHGEHDDGRGGQDVAGLRECL